MIKFFGYEKIISQLLILLYLLIGAGLGNSLILCEEADAYTHLEFKPAGICQFTCLGEGRAAVTGTAQLALSVFNSGSDCLDSAISFSHVPVPRDANILSNSAPVSWASCGFVSPPSFASISLIKLNLASQPPPRQSLIALRSVVLLH